MTPELMLAVGVLFVSVAFAAGYVALEVLQRRAPAQAAASRGRRWRERPRDESAARRRRAGSAARAREPVPAEVAEGHVAAPEADGARRLSQPDGARVVYTMCRARPAAAHAGALRLFSRHDAAACSSARCWRIIGYMLPGFWLSRQAGEAKEAHRQRPSRCARPADRLRRSRHGPRSGASRRRPRNWPCRTRRSRRSSALITTEIRAGKPRHGGVQELRRAHEGR